MCRRIDTTQIPEIPSVWLTLSPSWRTLKKFKRINQKTDLIFGTGRPWTLQGRRISCPTWLWIIVNGGWLSCGVATDGSDPVVIVSLVFKTILPAGLEACCPSSRFLVKHRYVSLVSSSWTFVTWRLPPMTAYLESAVVSTKIFLGGTWVANKNKILFTLWNVLSIDEMRSSHPVRDLKGPIQFGR